MIFAGYGKFLHLHDKRECYYCLHYADINIHFYFEKKNFHSLDFEQFTLNGPADSTETDGGACTDQFTVTVSTYFG